jgi:hypothetical protein
MMSGFHRLCSMGGHETTIKSSGKGMKLVAKWHAKETHLVGI